MTEDNHHDFRESGENIPLPRGWRQDEMNLSSWIEIYMKQIGRKSRYSRQILHRNDIPREPSNLLLDSVMDSWRYLEHGGQADPVGLYTNVPGIEFRPAVNVITDKLPYYHKVPGGNSYFSAVAMLLYGEANAWYYVRAHHLQFLEQVTRDKSHPRNVLYLDLATKESGSTGLALSERLAIPDCHVYHDFIQQVTVDLYGIFLVTFSLGDNASSITDVQCRGIYNAPHKFILCQKGGMYNPLVPRVDRPSEYRFPKITYEGTKGLIGVDQGLDPTTNDGTSHPWRMVLRTYPTPEKLSPTPIQILGPASKQALETVLWVHLREKPGEYDLINAENKETSNANKIKSKAVREEMTGASAKGIPPGNIDGEEERKKNQHTERIHQPNVKSASSTSMLAALPRPTLPQPTVPRTLFSKGQVEALKDAAGPLRKIGDTNKETVVYDVEEDEQAGVFYESIIKTTTRVITYVRINSDEYTEYPTITAQDEEQRGSVLVARSEIPASREVSPSSETDTPIPTDWLSPNRNMTMKKIREECTRRNINIPTRLRAHEVKQIFGRQLTNLDNAAVEARRKAKRQRKENGEGNSSQRGSSRKRTRGENRGMSFEPQQIATN